MQIANSIIKKTQTDININISKNCFYYTQTDKNQCSQTKRVSSETTFFAFQTRWMKKIQFML